MRQVAALHCNVINLSGSLEHVAASGIVTADVQTWTIKCTVEAAFEVVSRLKSIDANDTAWEHHQKMVPSQFTSLM